MRARQEKAGNKSVKAGSKPGSVSTCDKDKLIDELRNRVEFLEKELRLKQEEAPLLEITELKQGVAEHADELRASRQSLVEKSRYLDAFFNHTIIPLVLLDSDFNFIRVNEAYARACQKEVDEFPGNNHFEFYPSDARAIFEDVVRTRQPFRVAARPFVFPDHPEWGVTYWNWTLTPLLDDRGEAEALVFSLEDVTERKRAEIELERHRDRLQELVQERTRDLESANDQLHYEIRERIRAEETLRESEEKLRCYYELPLIGMALTSLEKGWLQANDEICRILGYSRDELFRMRWDEITFPDDLDKDLELYSRLLSGEIDNYTTDKRFVSKNGEVIPTQISIGCIRNPDKSIRYIVGLMQDITERKRAEEALREAKMQAELYLDLMGHDINNMHQIVLGYLEIAEGMMSPDDGRREYIEKPIEVLQRSAQLIKNVRKLQKLKEGGFQSQEVDVCQLLVDVRWEFGSVPHKTITVDLNGCEQCHVRANELLHDVFSNLVSNAIKHTGDRANIEIGISVVNDNDNRYCRVIVEDNGPGIPDDFKDKIFNRLLKGTEKTKGMGLGLYLVKSLVDSFGGRVWVEDRVPGDHTKGARFMVMLPATKC